MFAFASAAVLVSVTVLGVPFTHRVGLTEIACQDLPVNLRVSDHLQSTVTTLRSKSPTFRRQCAAIAAAPHVLIGATLTTTYLGPRTRARATASWYHSRLIVVTIEIPAVSEYVELLAHELEHVTELIEGVDLPALARDRPMDAIRLEDGAYETSRARAAGVAAASEVYGRDVDPVFAAIGHGIARAARATWRVLAWPRLSRARTQVAFSP